MRYLNMTSASNQYVRFSNFSMLNMKVYQASILGKQNDSHHVHIKYVGWLKGTSTGNKDFSGQIWGFRQLPLSQICKSET